MKGSCNYTYPERGHVAAGAGVKPSLPSHCGPPPFQS